MAKSNQSRPGTSAQYGGGQSFEESPARNVAGGTHESGDDPQSGDRPSSVSSLRQRADDYIAASPNTSVLTGFGLGFGFGLVVTLLLTRREETWYERHVPESLRKLPNRLEKLPESVASQVSQAWNRW